MRHYPPTRCSLQSIASNSLRHSSRRPSVKCRFRHSSWRQIWRVAGRESGSPELLEVPGLPRKFPELPWQFFGDFPGSSLTVELNSNPDVPRKFPRRSPEVPQTSPEVPALPGGQPLSLGSLTPSPDSQKLSLIKCWFFSFDLCFLSKCRCCPLKCWFSVNGETVL